MRKLIIASITVLFISVNAFAQISVGPKFGVNVATLSGDPGENMDKGSKIGLNAGAAVNIGVSEKFSIQPEILFSQQGSTSEGTRTITVGSGMNTTTKEVDVKETFTMNYLRIPALAKLSFGSESFKFYVNAGPYFGYWLIGKSKTESGGDTNEEEIEFDDDDFYNRVDVGLSAGAGVGFEAGPGALIVDLRYGLGLTDILDVEQEPDDYTPRQNRVFSATVGYLYKFGGGSNRSSPY